MLERLLGDSLAALRLGPRDGEPSAATRGRGPVWGAESEDLNATLLAWGAGTGPTEHVNAERDVLVFVVEGSATVVLDGEERRLGVGEALMIAKGQTRRITGGPDGVRYLAVHRRRPRRQSATRAASPA